MEAASLDALLSSQDSPTAWLRLLKSKDIHDPLLKAALHSVPSDNIPSRQELTQRLHKLRSKLEAFALLPPSGGGLLAQMAASIGASLKIKAPPHLTHHLTLGGSVCAGACRVQ